MFYQRPSKRFRTSDGLAVTCNIQRHTDTHTHTHRHTYTHTDTYTHREIHMPNTHVLHVTTTTTNTYNQSETRYDLCFCNKISIVCAVNIMYLLKCINLCNEQIFVVHYESIATFYKSRVRFQEVVCDVKVNVFIPFTEKLLSSL